MTIPKGKQVIILENNSNILDRSDIAKGVTLSIAEDIAFNLSSSFEALYSGGGNKILNLVGTAARDVFGPNAGFSSQFKEFGFQTWTRSEPITFSTTFTFYRGQAGAWNSLTEVVNPMWTLAKLCLPEERKNGEGSMLIAPGPSILRLLSDDSEAGQLGKQISIQISNLLFLPNIVVKRAEPVFSKEVDSNGHPIFGKIQLEISSLFNATGNMLG